jgi:protein-disulfide isomerase
MPKHNLINLLVMGSMLICFVSGTAVFADPLSFPEQRSLEQTIEEYIESHPELIGRALKSLEIKRQEEKKVRMKEAITRYQSELLYDLDSPVSGNVSGDVTVIEFFDYRCSYCKRVAKLVTQLQLDDSGVRIVYKDFPILGEMSVFASRAALAAQSQGKHRVFHEAMMASEGDLTVDTVLAIAKRVGLDIGRLQNDMGLPKWDAIMERNRELANVLTITGTPTFVTGDEFHQGVLSYEGIKQLVAKARTQ